MLVHSYLDSVEEKEKDWKCKKKVDGNMHVMFQVSKDDLSWVRTSNLLPYGLDCSILLSYEAIVKFVCGRL